MKTSIEILRIMGVPGWVLSVPKEEQDGAEKMHDEILAVVASETKKRHEEVLKAKQSIKEWKEEMAEFAREARDRYLASQEKMLLTMFRDNKARYVELMRTDADGWEVQALIADANDLVKRMRAIESERKGRDAKEQITPEMIERAREYPIGQIVEVEQNGRARCVFHGGESANMDIRRNFTYCYKCNKSSDSIGVYMALHGVGFKQAVLALV